MVKGILVSDRENIVKVCQNIFDKLRYETEVLTDEILLADRLNINHYDFIIFDTLTGVMDFDSVVKKIKPALDFTSLLLIVDKDFSNRNLSKFANALVDETASEEFFVNTLLMSLRSRSALEKLANTNKDLADNNYRLNALYTTSSRFAETLDKEKLIDCMIEGVDKALSYSLMMTLSFCGAEPVLIINSLYELSEELVSLLKERIIMQYKSLFEGKSLPYEIDEKSLKVRKTVKYSASRFNFSLFEFDNMFVGLESGENFFGCSEIFKETPFSTENATCFQTLARQVTFPLKNATLYQEIKNKNQKLARLERLKSEFISIVSHELRTPLTSIKNSLDIMLSGRCGELTNAYNKFLTMAKRNSQRLSGIINDLLDISKIEAGKMDYHFEEIGINTVVEYIKSTLSPLIKEKEINLIIEEGENLPKIHADAQRLEQVLTNLVSNAVKFTPEGKNITIRTEVLSSKDFTYPQSFAPVMDGLEGDYVVTSVIDEGIGIAGENLLHIFDKFAQIENSLSRNVGGSGLGLPIARQLIEAHNGVIWCDSELEKGSTFRFAIPITKRPVQTALV